MERIDYSPQEAIEGDDKTLLSADIRTKYSKVLGVLGLTVLFAAVPDAVDKAHHEIDTMRQENAVEELRAEETPNALTYAHNQVSQTIYNADAIAREVINSDSDRIELVKGEELERVFGSDMVKGDKLIVDNTTFFVKYAFSADGKNHLVVTNRIISEDINPKIIGIGSNKASAFRDAANKLAEASAVASLETNNETREQLFAVVDRTSLTN